MFTTLGKSDSEVQEARGEKEAAVDMDLCRTAGRDLECHAKQAETKQTWPKKQERAMPE